MATNGMEVFEGPWELWGLVGMAKVYLWTGGYGKRFAGVVWAPASLRENVVPTARILDRVGLRLDLYRADPVG